MSRYTGPCLQTWHRPEPQAEGVLQVTTRPDSGGATPTKTPPGTLNVGACSKSPPVKIKRQPEKSPLARDTPSREAVLRQNVAHDLMSSVDEEVSRWVVGAAEPRKELIF